MENLIGYEIGGYQIIEVIGRGSMSTIYKAYEAAADRLLALKILHQEHTHGPNCVARFKQTAILQANLEHPYILPVHAFGEQDGIHFLAMRYLSGGSLEEYIEQYGPLALGEACRLLIPIASALDYVHHRALVHRNVKPSRILLDEAGNAYLSGFSEATLAQQNPDPSRPPIFGTPVYMAPEMMDKGGLTHLIDVYSLGIVLYEMVTGRVPFEADTPMGVILKHLAEPPPPPSTLRPGLSEAVEQVIFKALEKDPEARFKSCGDLALAYEQAVFKVQGIDSLGLGGSLAPKTIRKESKTVTAIIGRAIGRLVGSPVGLALLLMIAFIFQGGITNVRIRPVVKEVYAYLFDFLSNLIR